ncbi:MAG: hypothetical protein K2J65_02385 [Duncaniella sp.]|nr:hypothetical protein [Duncaniella sp.]
MQPEVFTLKKNKFDKDVSVEDYKKTSRERVKRAGGESYINSIRLYSINYEGKVNVRGSGKNVYAGPFDDRDTCDFEIKLQASEANCNVVLKVKRNRTKEGWITEGVAYKKI